ncbi:hypothetical protein LHJ74_06365 [Streptomyces sp. N2-109]|uniref:Outer membrane lipoprotein BamD-like domain-containing protein n=1 Tax=Streptomyces gossypii TaxID=2883101 RepID=A0ABT2JNV4_9ACTN|nr:hypothetical protein [Streptomyces gossypii]MCT2589550.1 hypothetical protein [Streptomyces gossypii]
MVTDWLRNREKTHDLLDRSGSAADKTAPEALARCAEEHMDEEDWEQAQAHYQQLIDQFPDSERVAQAKKGLTKATQTIELEHVRRFLGGRRHLDSRVLLQPGRIQRRQAVRQGHQPCDVLRQQHLHG